MLNGKFYTGLPPKMMDRGIGESRNRMESHLFWPDDTKVDTAIESRIKRRNSVQLPRTESPLYEKQTSVVNSDVDNKKRFTKEFSQSSIKFYDNLNENCSNSRRPMLSNTKINKRMEISEEPTNTKLDMPTSMANEAYTAAKKKQAYTSKIEFYDYVNDREESQNNRNNLRKPKMDMNDKREMELNSKNSPKLQVKRDVRSLSEEKDQCKINNREATAIERNEQNSLKSRSSIERSMNISPKRGPTKANNYHAQGYSCDREIYRGPPSVYYENSEENEYGQHHEESKSYRNVESLPRDYEYEQQRIIRNNTRRYYDAPDDKNYSQNYQNEETLRNRMRELNLKSMPPRKQYYTPEGFYDDEMQYNYDRNSQIRTPTNRRSSYQHFDYNNRIDNDVCIQYNSCDNRAKPFNNDNMPFNKNQQESVRTATSPTPSDAESSVSATKSQKHLRSSLCFNNGEIIGENDAIRSPTSSQYPTQKRNARSSATQRVSVGLPD